MPTISKRLFLLAGSAMLTAGIGPARARDGSFAVTLTDAEWRRRLGPGRYRVLRGEGTERPYSSPLDREKRPGLFGCAGCGQAAFRSEDKYDSRTGWPSFTAPIAGSVGTAEDRSLGTSRTAVHCSRCGGHFGHVFGDGPAPTGKRYCMNGLALSFAAAWHDEATGSLPWPSSDRDPSGVISRNNT